MLPLVDTDRLRDEKYVVGALGGDCMRMVLARGGGWLSGENVAGSGMGMMGLAGPDPRRFSALTPHTMNDMRASTRVSHLFQHPAGHVASSPSSHLTALASRGGRDKGPRPVALRLHLLADAFLYPTHHLTPPCLGGPLLPPALKNQAPRIRSQLSLPAEPSRPSAFSHAQTLQTLQRGSEQGQSCTYRKLPSCKHTEKRHPFGSTPTRPRFWMRRRA